VGGAASGVAVGLGLGAVGDGVRLGRVVAVGDGVADGTAVSVGGTDVGEAGGLVGAGVAGKTAVRASVGTGCAWASAPPPAGPQAASSSARVSSSQTRR